MLRLGKGADVATASERLPRIILINERVGVGVFDGKLGTGVGIHGIGDPECVNEVPLLTGRSFRNLARRRVLCLEVLGINVGNLDAG